HLSGEYKAKLSSGEPGNIDDIIKTTLDTDLKEIGAAWFDKNINNHTVNHVVGPVVLQLEELHDVSSPKNVDVESMLTATICRLSLSDGHISCSAVTLEPIKGLNVRTPPGSKVLLSGKIEVNRNFLLLANNNISLLGGQVNSLVEPEEEKKNQENLVKETEPVANGEGDKINGGEDKTNGREDRSNGEDKTNGGEDKTNGGEDKTNGGQDTLNGEDKINGGDKTNGGEDKQPPPFVPFGQKISDEMLLLTKKGNFQSLKKSKEKKITAEEIEFRKFREAALDEALKVKAVRDSQRAFRTGQFVIDYGHLNWIVSKGFSQEEAFVALQSSFGNPKRAVNNLFLERQRNHTDGNVIQPDTPQGPPQNTLYSPNNYHPQTFLQNSHIQTGSVAGKYSACSESNQGSKNLDQAEIQITGGKTNFQEGSNQQDVKTDNVQEDAGQSKPVSNNHRGSSDCQISLSKSCPGDYKSSSAYLGAGNRRNDQTPQNRDFNNRGGRYGTNMGQPRPFYNNYNRSNNEQMLYRTPYRQPYVNPPFTRPTHQYGAPMTGPASHTQAPFYRSPPAVGGFNNRDYAHRDNRGGGDAGRGHSYPPDRRFRNNYMYGPENGHFAHGTYNNRIPENGSFAQGTYNNRIPENGGFAQGTYNRTFSRGGYSSGRGTPFNQPRSS
ncbi:unnamed protein product, partial [Candidula unifasciata]